MKSPFRTALLTVFLAACGCVVKPPCAEVIPQETDRHGETRIDPYYWLRNRDAPAVLAYLKAENAYTNSVMAHTKRLQETLYSEMVGRIEETDQDVPVRIDDCFYYARTEKGRQYRIYCRRKGSMKAPEEVLLDLNALASGQKYLQLGAYRISPDHRLLAYNIDTTGSELYTVRVKDLATGQGPLRGRGQYHARSDQTRIVCCSRRTREQAMGAPRAVTTTCGRSPLTTRFASTSSGKTRSSCSRRRGGLVRALLVYGKRNRVSPAIRNPCIPCRRTGGAVHILRSVTVR